MDTTLCVPSFRPPSFGLSLSEHVPMTDTSLLRVGTMVYVWMDDGEDYWFVPTSLNGQLVSGFRNMEMEWVFVAFFTGEIKGFA